MAEGPLFNVTSGGKGKKTGDLPRKEKTKREKTIKVAFKKKVPSPFRDKN